MLARFERSFCRQLKLVVVPMLAAAGWSWVSSVCAQGLYEDGAGPRAKAMGGAGTAAADDAMSALFDNPAALAGLRRPTTQLVADGAFEHGNFHNVANSDAPSDNNGAIGEMAGTLPLGPVTFGVGFNPDIAARDHWHYRDAPGGAEGLTTYGIQPEDSEIVLLRTALGVGWSITPQFSVGANLGLLYNQNELRTPYVFQTQPTLRGAKTLLNLRTEGFGVNTQEAIRWRPIPTLSLNVAYTSRARVETFGRATGNPGVQFANLGLATAEPEFRYDAKVTNIFPQMVSTGIAWEARHGLTLAGQFDWIDWSDAFATLPVRLTHGNNADLNALVGSTRLADNVPLRWRDQYIGRFGVEQVFGKQWSVRAGYAYGNNPIPAGTLTPLNAAITEHVVTTGLGYKTGRWRFDAAYQWQIPASERVHESDLASGEYSDSVTRVTVQTFSLSAGVEY